MGLRLSSVIVPYDCGIVCSSAEPFPAAVIPQSASSIDVRIGSSHIPFLKFQFFGILGVLVDLLQLHLERRFGCAALARAVLVFTCRSPELGYARERCASVFLISEKIFCTSHTSRSVYPSRGLLQRTPRRTASPLDSDLRRHEQSEVKQRHVRGSQK